MNGIMAFSSIEAAKTLFFSRQTFTKTKKQLKHHGDSCGISLSIRHLDEGTISRTWGEID